MPDIAAQGQCRFYNCTHLRPSRAAASAAVDGGTIHPSRYRIYRELFEEVSRQRW